MTLKDGKAGMVLRVDSIAESGLKEHRAAFLSSGNPPQGCRQYPGEPGLICLADLNGVACRFIRKEFLDYECKLIGSTYRQS